MNIFEMIERAPQAVRISNSSQSQYRQLEMDQRKNTSKQLRIKFLGTEVHKPKKNFILTNAFLLAKPQLLPHVCIAIKNTKKFPSTVFNVLYTSWLCLSKT